MLALQDSRGNKGAFSSSPRNSKEKHPWGPPASCELVLKKDGMNLIKKFKFTNSKNETASFNIDLLQTLSEVNPFTQRITSMKVNHNCKLLACYLSLVQYSENFVFNQEGVHDQNGFKLNGEGLQLSDIEQLGGTYDSYLEFVNLVKHNALDCNRFNTPKRKKSNNSPEGLPAKLPRKDQVNVKESEELEDPNGLEIQLQKSYIGVADIPITNISVHEDLVHSVVPEKVREIEREIRNRYDPSQAVLVVCPRSGSTPQDLNNVQNEYFLVVKKIKTFLALKELDAKGEFKNLTGHADRKVLCYVINPEKNALVHYGNNRGNQISSKFLTKNRPQVC